MLEPPTFRGWFPATRRMIAVTLAMFLGCRDETDLIAALDVLRECTDEAADRTLGVAPLFSASQRLVSLSCELTVVYFPW